MLEQSLIDVVNSGNAIAFVGSGVSAGIIPMWGELFQRAADTLQAEGVTVQTARDSARANRLPEAFERLVNSAGGPQRIHDIIRDATSRGSPGSHHQRLTDWPFRLYITSNYDGLLEASARYLVPVGNEASSLALLTGDARDVVWHIHGSAQLPKSRLVVSESDYQEIYPDSAAARLLESLTRVRRCVFFGFGFADTDLLHLLTSVARIARGGHPHFAFLGFPEDVDIRAEVDRIRRDYNVQVIPYRIRGRDHSELTTLLGAYNAFIVRRSMQFDPQPAVGYDAAVASLWTQSALDLREIVAARPESVHVLLAARIVARIREKPDSTFRTLLTDCCSHDLSAEQVANEIAALRNAGYLSNEDPPKLTAEYEGRVARNRATVELDRQRFHASLHHRAVTAGDFTDPSSGVACVADFLTRLCRDRGLGVAQNLMTTDADQIARRTVSLLQALPEQVKHLGTRSDALAAVRLTSEVLTRATDAEARYLGLLCQAYFGVHLVGASSAVSKLDRNLLAKTCYIVDGSVLVVALARGSEGHEFTLQLLKDIRESGAIIATTDLFLGELVEHANWALRLADRFGEDSSEFLDAVLCRNGYRPNEFIRGFSASGSHGSFRDYMKRTLNVEPRKAASDAGATRRLSDLGIIVRTFATWEGFDIALFGLRERTKEEIKERRQRKGTLKHDRQAQAEAEVAVIVDQIRAKKLNVSLPGAVVDDAFFLSSTRVVDDLPNLTRRISLLPVGLAQWLWSVSGVSDQHAYLVYEQIVADLAHEGMAFVDKKTLLRRFSGVIEAARDELQSAVRDRREYLVMKYGPDPDRAFSDSDPFDLPRRLREVKLEIYERMDAELRMAKDEVRVATETARLTAKEQKEFAALRQRTAEKRAKAERKKKAALSKRANKRKRK